MKMYPIQGKKFDSQAYGVIKKSPCSRGKFLIEFPDGNKVHVRKQDLMKFFSKEPSKAQLEAYAQSKKKSEAVEAPLSDEILEIDSAVELKGVAGTSVQTLVDEAEEEYEDYE